MVEALGVDDGEISFSGIFSGIDAVSRAQLLDAARVLGASLPLIWDDFFYTVFINDFTAEYRKTNLIPFSITCIVTADPLTSLAATVAPVTNLIGNDLSVASALSGQAGVSLNGLGAASIAGLSVVQGTLNTAISTTSVALSSTATDLNNAADASSGVAAISQLSLASSQLAALASMSGYVSRASANLASELVMSNQSVTSAGGNLFALAAKYLNDATQWIRIAQANNLSDPLLQGVNTLVIPPVNASAGGGIAG